MAILAECPICHRKLALRHKVCTGNLKGGIPCEADLAKLKRSRKVRYWISYRVPGGKGKQRMESVGFSIEEARDAIGKRRAQKREKRPIFAILPEAKMTFREMAGWYLNLSKVRALSSYWRVELSLKNFNSVFGEVIVDQIRPADLENYQADRKAQGKADATIDQEMGGAKTVIVKAFDNGMVSGETMKTFRVIKALLKGNSNARNRVLTPNEYEALVENAPAHIKPVIAAGYYSGMRKGEILNLTWDKVSLKNRVIRLEPEDTKDKEARDIPICDELLGHLRGLPRSIGATHVFLYRDAPMREFRTSLKKACAKAGIIYGRYVKDGFVFHDLRHTFNTYMRKSGVAESVIMEITGHSTRTMFDRYNTIDEEDTRQAMDQMQDYLRNVNQTVNQVAKS